MQTKVQILIQWSLIRTNTQEDYFMAAPDKEANRKGRVKLIKSIHNEFKDVFFWGHILIRRKGRKQPTPGTPKMCECLHTNH